jgi:transcription-repair coupling factor (superfamily II helicase)
MSEQYQFTLPERYTLPAKAGDVRLLGQLTGSACAMECAQIAEKHTGPVVLITSNIQSALRLRDEIQQFTSRMVTTLSDWETLSYDSFSPHQRYYLSAPL